MQRTVLVGALAAVFAGMAALLVVIAALFQWGLLLLAIPLALTAVLMWYQASGRLRERAKARAGGERTRARGRFRAAGGGLTRDATTGPRGRRTARSSRAAGRQRTGPTATTTGTGMSPTEAASVLGVDPTDDEDTVRDAYRRKVKRAHPDTDSGDEEAFKRVKTAYETLSASE